MSEDLHRLPTLTTSWHYRHGMCGVFDGEVTCGLPRGHSVDVRPHRFHSPSAPFSRWIETDDYGREVRRGGPWEPGPRTPDLGATDPFGAKPTAKVVIDPERPTSTAGTGRRHETWTHGDFIHRVFVHVDEEEFVRLPYNVLATMLMSGGWGMVVPHEAPKPVNWSLFGEGE